jgi:hypothetical protein
VHAYVIYYKLDHDRATYIGRGCGRSEGEAYLDFKRSHRGESFRVLKIVLDK